MAISFDPTSLGLEVGGGAVIGGITGYAAKKIAKIIAILVGVQLALFKFLETRGILEVNWDKLSSTATNVTQQATSAAGETPPSWASSLLSTLPVGAGFTAGFALGFKNG